ncbi:kinase-like domain-containing protein [Mycena sp. CBHHK59/15]|nr:kinase-like domain-containing protein [Mycena sp. CBHHK59/15]
MDGEHPAGEDMEQTQEDQVQTQPLTQPGSIEQNDNLWGYLNPCLSPVLSRVELYKDCRDVTVGRNTANIVIFPGFKISNFHAVIRWNGKENADSVVIIEDMSSNGTFINGDKIGKGQQRILKDGNEVAFGIATTSKEQNGLFDYRFIFRDLVAGVVKRALYKSYDMSVELGKGSFATVYKALHMASGEWVAVKVIHETKRQGPPATTASEAARIGRARTSSREINIMETLRHPNICLLREVFWNLNGSIDLVLELVEGGDLLDFILTHNGLSEKMAKHITYQLCQALSYIHGKGITHRDLKPENVLLTKDNPPVVKVADFGLAKIVDSMTMLKTMCGTPSYLAPEVVTQQNNSGYDSLVDSWSVGVIVFSTLTNTNPFLETSAEDLKTRIAERNIDWSQLDTLQYGSATEGYFGLTDAVKHFLRCLLDFDPRTRLNMRDALSHPWLTNYQPFYKLDYPDTGAGAGGASRDVSMRTADSFDDGPSEVSQGFEHLQLTSESSETVVPQAAPAAGATTPPSNSPPGLALYKRNALERRSEVLQRAVETGKALVEPSWEMVNYAQSQEQGAGDADDDQALYCAPNANGSGSEAATKGPNKRVHAELTPLPDEGARAGSSASSPLSSLEESPPVPARKKGKSADAAVATPKPKAAGGRRAPKTPASARKKAAPDDELPTRRSTRAKSGRR